MPLVGALLGGVLLLAIGTAFGFALGRGGRPSLTSTRLSILPGIVTGLRSWDREAPPQIPVSGSPPAGVGEPGAEGAAPPTDVAMAGEDPVPVVIDLY